MKINFGFIISKVIRLINRPALRDCKIDSKAKVGTGSNCINLIMGQYSYMGKNNSVTNTIIGKYCSIASYCSIGGGAHDINHVSTSPLFKRERYFSNRNSAKTNPTTNKKVIIGNDVWIGECVFIVDGISIGDGAIIGAHSVVTRNVPAYAIVAGVPAKIIRNRFDEEIIHDFLKIKWWNFDDEKIRKLSVFIDNPKEFIKMAGEI